MMLLSLLGVLQAHAFCGTYVSSAGTEVYNSASEVVIARQGTRTTLTMANDVIGDPSDFAMVVPVPQVVLERDVNVISPDDIEVMRTYTMPRLVSYVCDDFKPTFSHPCSWMDDECPTDSFWDRWRGQEGVYLADAGEGEGEGEGGGAASDGSGGASSVEVEAQYIVGEYELVVLSADQSQDLLYWLEDEGYDVPENTANVLQQYIDAGNYFLAARVYPDAELGDGDSLSPLQFSYDSEVFGLPIRLGTTSSVGEQDLIVYVVNSNEDGAVGISNYPELEVESECMWDGEGEFGEFYADQFANAYGHDEGAIWTTEYTWKNEPQAVKCDPCTGPPPDTQQLTNVGYDDEGTNHFHVTRLHLRYTPEEATQDLVFYHSRQTPQRQKRYIEYKEDFEDRYPLCGSGWSADPATCEYDDPFEDTVCLTRSDWRDQCDMEAEASCGGCSAQRRSSAPIWFGLSMLLVGLRRRR
jgi:hypothetical protein